MWRIYTQQKTIDYLADKHNLYMACGPDMEVYVSDPVFRQIIDILITDDNCSDFRAEIVTESEYIALCESYGFTPDLMLYFL